MLSERSLSSVVVFDADAVIGAVERFHAESAAQGHGLTLRWAPLPSAAGLLISYKPADNRLVPAGRARVTDNKQELQREWGQPGTPGLQTELQA